MLKFTCIFFQDILHLFNFNGFGDIIIHSGFQKIVLITLHGKGSNCDDLITL